MEFGGICGITGFFDRMAIFDQGLGEGEESNHRGAEAQRLSVCFCRLSVFVRWAIDRLRLTRMAVLLEWGGFESDNRFSKMYIAQPFFFEPGGWRHRYTTNVFVFVRLR